MIKWALLGLQSLAKLTPAITSAAGLADVGFIPAVYVYAGLVRELSCVFMYDKAALHIIYGRGS